MKYKFLNNIAGWVAFLIAAITYLLTIEPTASFWDCGEFITTSYKFEVGHPPGAPFFMLLGRMFNMFGGPHNAAVLVNILSALASAFTILFLFWTITHLAKRLIANNEDPSLAKTIVILGCGMVGALAYTFSDTFWFSAVEAEVYATSSLFTALVFWAILKWENVADEPGANRWLILICYLAGLSVGVHLLNLLAIPAIVFIYYYKKYNVTSKGICAALIVSALILGLILYGIIPGVIKIATWFELLFINGFGLPINTGMVFYAILLIAAFIFGILYTYKKQKVVWNTILLCVAVIVLGYGSYAIIPIRSAVNPPMDQNSPDNAFAMLSYLNREQYGDRPLLFGQYYNSPLDAENSYVDDKNEYATKNGRYIVSNMRQKPNYQDEFCTVFPRMWSRVDPRHEEAYKQWGEIKGTKMVNRSARGESQTIIKPTFGENLRFFFRYQVNFMYFRYFMWNFAGRQNDIQGDGNVVDGNWISGIKFLDEARLGNQDNLPAKYADNPARNTYFLLPLILGILGIFFQYNSGKQGKRDLWVVTLLFVATGLAIVVYLNQSPYQPRERDYAYAGSFYAFTIWIGLGVAWLYNLISKKIPGVATASAVSIICLFVPVLMAAQNWDDHSRAGRTVAPDFGKNYLSCVDPQGVIFTNGDNDTYPLWYNQEVEGFGTDLRVCNLSYFQTDWYVRQMQQKSYESEPLPISFTYEQYVQGTRDVVYIMEEEKNKGKMLELGKALEFIKSDNPATKLTYADNACYLPVRTLYLPVDKEKVIANKVVSPEQYDEIVDTMFIVLKGSYITKDQLMILDLLNNKWERPLYYAVSVGTDKYMGLDKYFRLEGLTYRIVPIEVNRPDDSYEKGNIDLDRTYKNMMEKFLWGNIADPKVYADENIRRMCSNLRNNFFRLAQELIIAGRPDSALAVLDKSMEVLPVNKIPYDYFTCQMVRAYFEVGAKDKANALLNDMQKELEKELDYYFAFDQKYSGSLTTEIRTDLYFMNEFVSITSDFGENTQSEEISSKFKQYYELFKNIMSN